MLVKDLSFAPFVPPPAIVHCRFVICVSRDSLQTIYREREIDFIKQVDKGRNQIQFSFPNLSRWLFDLYQLV